MNTTTSDFDIRSIFTYDDINKYFERYYKIFKFIFFLKKKYKFLNYIKSITYYQ